VARPSPRKNAHRLAQLVSAVQAAVVFVVVVEKQQLQHHLDESLGDDENNNIVDQGLLHPDASCSAVVPTLKRASGAALTTTVAGMRPSATQQQTAAVSNALRLRQFR
jgi:hypothetical protein